MNYTQTLEFLFQSLPAFETQGATGYKPGLERITAFCRHIGNPQRNFFTIHVAGTNGKGSVAHIIASVLQQAGYRTGLFTSPHLRDFRERIRVDGEMIPKQKVVNFVDKHHDKMVELELSFFEMTAAMAFDYFAQSDVEVAVIETGLGGRLDATNIIVPILCVITNIGLEHTALLGDTLPKIAREKAGIIKKSIPVIIGEADARYNEVFEQTAAANKSRVIYAEREFLCEEHRPEGEYQHFRLRRTRDEQAFDVELDLLGDYQCRNIVTASAAVDFLHEETPLTISRRAYLEGMKSRGQHLADGPLAETRGCPADDLRHGTQRPRNSLGRPTVEADASPQSVLRDRLRPRQGSGAYPATAAPRRPLPLHAGPVRTRPAGCRADRKSRHLRIARRCRRAGSGGAGTGPRTRRTRGSDLHRRQHLRRCRGVVTIRASHEKTGAWIQTPVFRCASARRQACPILGPVSGITPGLGISILPTLLS